MLLRLTSFAALALALAACGGSSGGRTPAPTLPVEVINLEAALGSSNIDPVGVTVSPTTGEVFLLDANLGLYSVTESGIFRLVAGAATLYVAAPISGYTDVASLGGGKFALTAMNDGYLLDLATNSIQQHFCYVPGFLFSPTNIPDQLTLSVAFDPITERILVQPLTLDAGTLNSINSEVGTFPLSGGVGRDWHPLLDPEFLAGAIAVDSTGMLWLGRGAELYRYDLTTDTMTFDQRLDGYPVTEIAGLAFDRDRLLVVDAPSRSLLRIPLAQLGL